MGVYIDSDLAYRLAFLFPLSTWCCSILLNFLFIVTVGGHRRASSEEDYGLRVSFLTSIDSVGREPLHRIFHSAGKAGREWDSGGSGMEYGRLACKAFCAFQAGWAGLGFFSV